MKPDALHQHLPATSSFCALAAVEAAVYYAARYGWRVTPLHSPTRTGPGAACSCRRSTCDAIGKHPIFSGWRGENSTTDPATIREWWRRFPHANVGIVMGKPSGIWALDVDVRRDGDRLLEALCDAHGELPTTAHAITGSGGDHYLFTMLDRPVPKAVAKWGPGVDVQGDGSLIVAAPSLHACGARYAWDAAAGLEVAAAPAWLLDLAAPIPPPPPPPRAASTRAVSLPMLTGYEALDVLVNECAFIAHASNDTAAISYKEWFALASILHPFPAGDQLFDQISRLDPARYSAAVVERKIKSIRHAPAGCTSLGWTCPKLTECGAIGVRSPAGLPFKLLGRRGKGKA